MQSGASVVPPVHSYSAFKEQRLTAVIAENDESQWSDETGVIYHFPKRYSSLLSPGTKVLYYKGRLRDPQYAARRLSKEAHYFGVGVIGTVHTDPASSKGDLFATIEKYRKFSVAVVAKRVDGSFYERIPANRESSFWRDGVRDSDDETLSNVLSAAGEKWTDTVREPEPDQTEELTSGQEGQASRRYVTTYERDPAYRRQALAIHGFSCAACGVNMSKRYGIHAEGLIHVHHVQPVSTYEAPRRVDPAVDLVSLCPNCHAVVHYRKDRTLSVEDVRQMLAAAQRA